MNRMCGRQFLDHLEAENETLRNQHTQPRFSFIFQAVLFAFLQQWKNGIRRFNSGRVALFSTKIKLLYLENEIGEQTGIFHTKWQSKIKFSCNLAPCLGLSPRQNPAG